MIPLLILIKEVQHIHYDLDLKNLPSPTLEQTNNPTLTETNNSQNQGTSVWVLFEIIFGVIISLITLAIICYFAIMIKRDDFGSHSDEYVSNREIHDYANE